MREARAFHRERVTAIAANAVEGVELGARSGILFHLVPLASFALGYRVELRDDLRGEKDVRPLYAGPGYPWARFNSEGLFVADTAFGRSEAKQYLQLYRNGIIESFDSMLLNVRGSETILCRAIERTLIDDSERFLRLADNLDVSPPIVLFVTVIGALGRTIHAPELPDSALISEIDRELLRLPEIVVDRFDADTSQALRPMLDGLWQAGGLPGSPSYDDAGEWQRGE